jgi:hypothetical protein
MHVVHVRLLPPLDATFTAPHSWLCKHQHPASHCALNLIQLHLAKQRPQQRFCAVALLNAVLWYYLYPKVLCIYWSEG